MSGGEVLADDGVERVMVVVAHPDDADFWAGGTVARWSAAGIAVTYLVLTDGDAGGFDPAMPREDIPRIRRSEQEAAAHILGVRDVRFLGIAEGELALASTYPDAGNAFAHPTLVDTEALEPWMVEEIWLLNAREPNHFVDVTDTFDQKIEALRAHRSQTGHRDRLATEMRARIEPSAAAAGLPAGRLAEAFLVVHNR